jgi:hypothetical protein
MSTPNLDQLILELQEAQQRCVEAIERLNQHNVSEDAHDYILELIRGIRRELSNSETIYTRSQIEELVDRKMNAHLETYFKDAHPGWAEWEQYLTTKLSTIDDSITRMKYRLDQLTASKTTLGMAIQEVENRYSPIIENLTNSIKIAEEDGNTDLADQYRAGLINTINRRNEEILTIINNWSE